MPLFRKNSCPLLQNRNVRQSSKSGKDRQEVRTECLSERTNTRRRKLTNEVRTVGNHTVSCLIKQRSSVICRLRGGWLVLVFSPTLPHWFRVYLAFYLMCTGRQRNWREADNLSISSVNFNNVLNFISTHLHIWSLKNEDNFGRWIISLVRYACSHILLVFLTASGPVLSE
jgi:hypothetical protein